MIAELDPLLPKNRRHPPTFDCLLQMFIVLFVLGGISHRELSDGIGEGITRSSVASDNRRLP